jgi:hypothetical protein
MSGQLADQVERTQTRAGPDWENMMVSPLRGGDRRLRCRHTAGLLETRHAMSQIEI